MNKIKLAKKKLSLALQWFLRRSIGIKIIIVVVILGMGWFVFSRFLGSKSKQPQYQTAQVEKGTLVMSVTASGQVSSANNASVYMQDLVVVSKVFVLEVQMLTVDDKVVDIYVFLDVK